MLNTSLGIAFSKIYFPIRKSLIRLGSQVSGFGAIHEQFIDFRASIRFSSNDIHLFWWKSHQYFFMWFVLLNLHIIICNIWKYLGNLKRYLRNKKCDREKIKKKDPHTTKNAERSYYRHALKCSKLKYKCLISLITRYLHIRILLMNGINIPCIYICIDILTDVAPIRNANILVIDVTVIETPADLSANATRSVAGSFLSTGERLSIDYKDFHYYQATEIHSHLQ